MNVAEDVKRYVEICQEKFWQNIFQFETECLIERLQGCRDILSVGCGPAIIEGRLSGYGFNVTGLDVSAEALKCAPDSIRTFAGSAESMPFAESSFDAVEEFYTVQTEYILGVEGDRIFKSNNPSEAALYVIYGTINNNFIDKNTQQQREK
ncbi:hypothetical protein ER57_14410 [Smithella sp. SCADC]|jgi:SAM-dependent methyltransferase|nr:hypothetical protein ER57_15900 [Smithella sp. SCADC]KFO66860.1 hypothetical protein ER57_14410 [Smithella sp. SCADC]